MAGSTDALHDDYYRFVRDEISPLLPDRAHSILEIGAAAGHTLKWLKTKFPDAVTTGVELNDAVLPQLSRNADVAILGPIEKAIDQLESYDLILFLDVLEHLDDSLHTLSNVCASLNAGGTVIVSLPNVAHLSVSLPLLLRRLFEYQDAGILDRTHKRFFTERSAVKLLNDANLIVTDGLIAGIDGPRSKLLDAASFGLLRHHLTKQYIMSAHRSADGARQPSIHWAPASQKPGSGMR